MKTESKVYVSDEERERDCREILARHEWSRAKEGHEFWRRFGEVRHVYAFLMKDGSRKRIVGPPQRPSMFSDLKSLERTVKA